jgi:ATP synthase protein I
VNRPAAFALTSRDGRAKGFAVDHEIRKLVKQLAHASSIGIAMALAIFGSFFLGTWLDGRLGTEPWFTLLLLLAGIAAGFRNLYHLFKKYLKDEKALGTSVKREQHRKSPPAKKA